MTERWLHTEDQHEPLIDILEDNKLAVPLRPLSEMPIWARLHLIEKIPAVHGAFWGIFNGFAPQRVPLQVTDIFFEGFKRVGDRMWVYYYVNEAEGRAHYMGFVRKDVP